MYIKLSMAHNFGIAFVITPGSVIVVNTLFHEGADHFAGSNLVHNGIISVDQGETQTAHAKPGDTQFVKNTLDHDNLPFVAVIHATILQQLEMGDKGNSQKIPGIKNEKRRKKLLTFWSCCDNISPALNDSAK